MKILAGALFLIVISVEFSTALYFTELESLNPSQKVSLEKLKNSVSSILPHEYMKEDIFLVKYLQANGFSVRKAEDTLKDFVKWREQNKVESWEDPNFFAEFEKKGEYPVYNDGLDREGRPVLEIYYGDWNVREVAVAGKIKQLLHYAISRSIDRAARRVRELQSQGKNVTQFVSVTNMDGFNLINQACPICLPFYLGFVSDYEKYWPNSIYKSFMINTPNSFEGIMKAARPLMSPQSRKVLKIFGTNKNEWKPYLDDLIDPTELSDWYDSKGKERKIH